VSQQDIVNTSRRYLGSAENRFMAWYCREIELSDKEVYVTLKTWLPGIDNLEALKIIQTEKEARKTRYIVN